MHMPPLDRAPLWRAAGAPTPAEADAAAPASALRSATPAALNAPSAPSAPGAPGAATGESSGRPAPETPSSEPAPHRGWTQPETAKAREPDAAPKEPPLHQMLLDFLHSMWRASAAAIDASQAVHQQAQAQRLADQVRPEASPTYADPKSVRRKAGL